MKCKMVVAQKRERGLDILIFEQQSLYIDYNLHVRGAHSQLKFTAPNDLQFCRLPVRLCEIGRFVK